MEISVIIPVYNAEEFIIRAVDSALAQPEVKEIILIEDNSPDNSLAKCKQITKQNPIVKLFRHEDGQNHGAGATRNLGFLKANCDYIAFLDADDYYLPKRFEETKRTFKKHSDADGVYEAIGVDFMNSEAQNRFNKKFKNYNLELTTVSRKVQPEKLHEALICEKNFGWLTLDGLTIKKEILKIVGLFNPKLKIGQDTDFIHRLSYNSRLYPGNINDAVSKRGVHSNNRVLNSKKRLFNQKKLFATFQFQNAQVSNFSKRVNRQILINYSISSSYAIFKISKIFKYSIVFFILIKLLENTSFIKKIL